MCGVPAVPAGGYLAVGNAKGRVLLYRIVVTRIRVSDRNEELTDG